MMKNYLDHHHDISRHSSPFLVLSSPPSPSKHSLKMSSSSSFSQRKQHHGVSTRKNSVPFAFLDSAVRSAPAAARPNNLLSRPRQPLSEKGRFFPPSNNKNLTSSLPGRNNVDCAHVIRAKSQHEEAAVSIDENSNMSVMNTSSSNGPASSSSHQEPWTKVSKALRYQQYTAPNNNTDDESCRRQEPLETARKPASSERSRSYYYSRVSGEAAVATHSYKDDALRLVLYQQVQSTKILQNMLQFEDKPLNQHMPTGNVVSVIYDPIIEQPHVSGLWDYQRRRDQPLRMAVASSREAFDVWLDDLVAHRDEVIVTSDPFEIDKGVFGDRPEGLEEFWYKKE